MIRHKRDSNNMARVAVKRLKNKLETLNSVREASVNVKQTKDALYEGSDFTATADKLIRIGVVAIVSVPEPVMSNLFGAAMIAAGKLVKDRSSENLEKLRKDFVKFLSELKKTREELEMFKL